MIRISYIRSTIVIIAILRCAAAAHSIELVVGSDGPSHFVPFSLGKAQADSVDIGSGRISIIQYSAAEHGLTYIPSPDIKTLAHFNIGNINRPPPAPLPPRRTSPRPRESSRYLALARQFMDLSGVSTHGYQAPSDANQPGDIHAVAEGLVKLDQYFPGWTDQFAALGGHVVVTNSIDFSAGYNPDNDIVTLQRSHFQDTLNPTFDTALYNAISLAHETQHLINHRQDPNMPGNQDEASAMMQNYLVMMAASNDRAYAAHAADLRFNAGETLFYIHQLSRNLFGAHQVYDMNVDGWIMYPYSESVSFIANEVDKNYQNYLYDSSIPSADYRSYDMIFKGPENKTLRLHVTLDFDGPTAPQNTVAAARSCTADGTQCIADYVNPQGQHVKITVTR